MYWAGSAARLYSLLAPSSDGGFSDWEDVVARFYGDEVLRRERTKEEIIEQVSPSLIFVGISLKGQN